MVHLKTQQAYARNEGDQTTANQIQKWFDRFDSALQILLDEESIHIEYDYKKYDFKIRQNGREPFSFNELSDGYSSVIYIVSDLILRMDKNWLLEDKISEYDYQGIVLIDELETHLHIELQKKIFPFLTKFFPKIQFIVTTHSPYILNSISNAKAYDLERQVELDNLSGFSSDDLAEGYFEADAYSDELKNSLNRYEELCFRKDLTEDEFLVESKKIQLLCKKYRVPFIINDNVKLAKEIDADGVHVGQSDMEALDVRAQLGEDKIIGVSARTVEQALLAEKHGADYLGVGAVFQTGTKTDAREVEHSVLKEICTKVDIPVVAIGGITQDNVKELSGSGINGVAVISAIFAQKDIETATAKLKSCVEQMV